MFPYGNWEKARPVAPAIMALAALALLMAGCESGGATLVEIVYVTPAAATWAPQRAPLPTPPAETPMALAAEPERKRENRPSPAEQETPELSTPTPVPTASPTPWPTPTWTPFPTWTPAPTQTPPPATTPPVTTPAQHPAPTPTAAPAPTGGSDTEAADAQRRAALEAYEREARRVDEAYSLQTASYASMLESLNQALTEHPESQAEIQAEIDALQAQISQLRQQADAELQHAYEQYLAAVQGLP